MMTITEFLSAHVPVFEGIDPDLANTLARRMEQKVFKKGQTVVFRGSTVDGLHVLAAGKLSVHARTPNASAPVKIAELRPGDIVGEMSIMSGDTASATVKCDQDDTTVFVLGQDLFKALLDFNPDMENRTKALIAQRREELAKSSAKPR